jgi:delta1-piperideine-2-carboxylate reductase
LSELTNLSLTEASELAHAILRANGFSETHAGSITRNVVRAQIDDCQSHGLHRLLMCVRTARAGKVSLDATPTVRRTSANVVKVDAHSGFSLLAFEAGLPIVAAAAKETGVAAMAINRCFHFSALWPEVEDLAEQGLAAIAMLPSHSCVAPAGGSKAVFGTNPFAFAWPRGKGPPPYAFDFATSASARGEIEVHRRVGKPLPEGWAIDSVGQPTTDPAAALAGSLLPFGGHKGSALSTMIELLAGAMIGDFLSMDALDHAGTLDTAPRHGELILAFNPTLFGDDDRTGQTDRAERLFAAVTMQGARLPSARRFSARAKNLARGAVMIPRKLRLELEALKNA